VNVLQHGFNATTITTPFAFRYFDLAAQSQPLLINHPFPALPPE